MYVSFAPMIETDGLDPTPGALGDKIAGATNLPLAAELFPSGFRLIVKTNSRDVLLAASECWGGYVHEFGCEPVKLHVIVRPQGAFSPEPAYRCQRHLFSVIGDADNFAVADLERLFSFMVVSAKTAADHTWLRWFFVET